MHFSGNSAVKSLFFHPKPSLAAPIPTCSLASQSLYLRTLLRLREHVMVRTSTHFKVVHCNEDGALRGFGRHRHCHLYGTVSNPNSAHNYGNLAEAALCLDFLPTLISLHNNKSGWRLPREIFYFRVSTPP